MKLPETSSPYLEGISNALSSNRILATNSQAKETPSALKMQPSHVGALIFGFHLGAPIGFPCHPL